MMAMYTVAHASYPDSIPANNAAPTYSVYKFSLLHHCFNIDAALPALLSSLNQCLISITQTRFPEIYVYCKTIGYVLADLRSHYQ